MLRNALMLFCVYTTLPGPPGIYFEDTNYLQLYPIDRTLCPEIDSKRDIVYQLFTRDNPTTAQIITPYNDAALKNSKINFSNPTTIYFPGFMDNIERGSSKFVRDAYMQKLNHNFIAVNNPRLTAGPWYTTAVKNAKVIGKYTANFIDYLVSKGMELSTLHLVGVSLGAQIAGITGHYVKTGRVSRITGLDPAKPLFENMPRNLRLEKSDAEFVDIIHTAAGTFGYPGSLGHVDFYPNGGYGFQPGCSPVESLLKKPGYFLNMIFCNHQYSILLYIESVMNPNGFTSTRCDSWKSYSTGRCDDKCNCVHMGFGASNKTRGDYYLTTNADSPYSKF